MHKIFDGRIAKCRLRVVIIGAGVSGLSAAFCLGQAGHEIIVLESSAEIRETGAGIQLGPNMSRLLMRWGLADRLAQLAVKPLSVSFRRYETGERIGFAEFGDSMAFTHGAPYLHIHRADLIAMLASLSAPFADIRLSSRVKAVNPADGTVALDNGETITADLILGADGVRSVTRRAIFPDAEDHSIATGDAVFRVVIPTAPLLADPDLRALVLIPEATCWMGPGRHVVGYCISGAAEYNLVFLCPDSSSGKFHDSWTADGDVEEMRRIFANFEPQVQKLLKLTSTAKAGKLMLHRPLTTWLSENRRVALIGDACHSMLPYRAQGSAMAIEDAAVLGNLLSRITHKSQLTHLLEAYQTLRIGRATATQNAAAANQRTFHLPDGPEQQERDASMRRAMETRHDLNAGSANMWADRERSIEQFSYDADEAVDRWWRQNSHLVAEQAKL